MPRTQALMLQISTGDPRSISKQIVDAVRMKIATAELEPGDQLPSVRGLAQRRGAFAPPGRCDPALPARRHRPGFPA
jgi:hypothetical protein